MRNNRPVTNKQLDYVDCQNIQSQKDTIFIDLLAYQLMFKILRTVPTKNLPTRAPRLNSFMQRLP
jgi:hypothetical protein